MQNVGNLQYRKSLQPWRCRASYPKHQPSVSVKPGDVARRTFNAIICIRNFNKDAQRFMLPLICLAVVEQLHSMLLLYSSTGLKQRAPPEHIKLGAARLGFTTQGAGTCAPCIKLLA